jgi:SAM-dependent methyltransferase
MQRIAPEDWTTDAIGRFWDYFSSRPHRRELYFSRLVGDGLALYLDLHGVLSGTVLDFGCGPGFLFDHLARYRVECWGVDPSPDSVRLANERCAALPRFRGAFPAGGLPAGQTFDLVTCVETIEHVPADAAPGLLAEMKRLVKPGGTLLVTTPHDERLDDGMIYCPFCDREFHHMQHVRSFTAAGLAELLRENGFTVSDCRGIDLNRFCGPVRPLPPTMTGLAKARYRLGRLLGRDGRTREERLARLSTPGPHLVALAKPGA